jgi:glyoxalase family protein
MQLSGLHHVTAVTGNPAGNVQFYTQVLGLRLVKKTVNQDDTSAYHLFYADAVGSPGTDMTFFDWPLSPTRHGYGLVARTGFQVPGRAALDWWAGRLNELGIWNSGVIELGGKAQLHLSDPEGQQLALIDNGGQTIATPWERSPVPAEMAVGGLHAITMTVRKLDPTARFLTDLLNFSQSGSYTTPYDQQVTVFTTGEGAAVGEVHVIENPSGIPGQLGTGGVHHIAFRTPDSDTHRAWHDRLRSAGVGVSGLIDRFYFRSLYFREPGGILFEIATDGPGFATDEDAAHLGERLSLPPFLEGRRAQIEAGLRPIEMA